MGFQRATWHSGYTYRQTCDQCNTVVQYMDDVLDFRPWFADGFVYCPNCKKPLRHNENYAIDAPVKAENRNSTQNSADNKPKANFCANCGKRFGENDRFCGACGMKR